MNEIIDKTNMVEKLNDLIALDYDAISAYQTAVERLENPGYRDQLNVFMQDHENHIAALSQVVCQEGGAPVEKGDIKKILTKGSVYIAELAGDQGILKAMQLNEVMTNNRYEDNVEEAFPEPVHSILQNGLADERRHKEWLEATLNLFHAPH